MRSDLKALLSFILNKWQVNENDRELLELIKESFDADGVNLGLIDVELFNEGSGVIEFKHLFKDRYKETQADTIYLKGAFEEVLNSKRQLNISDYDAYKNRLDAKLCNNIKSLLSTPLLSRDKFYGVLQISKLKTGFFSQDDCDNAFIVSSAIASVVSYKEKDMKLEFNDTIGGLSIEISSSLKDALNIPFDKWLESILKKILYKVDSYITGFIMPYDNIYCVFSKDRNFTYFFKEPTQKVQDWIVYKMYKMGIKQTVTYKEAIDRFNLKPSLEAKKLGVVNGIFVPIEYNGEVVASFAYGFVEPIKDIGFHKMILKRIGLQLVLAIYSFKRLGYLNRVVSTNEEKFIFSLMKVAAIRDSYTKGHSQRVALYSKRIADYLNLTEREQNLLYVAGLLHDLGKIGVPDSVLLKPGKLSHHEFEIIKYHPVFSWEIIKDIDQFKEIALSVKHHHERCDGSGYPDGLKCKEIDFFTRILSIADIFDALTSTRAYRKKERYSVFEALDILKHVSIDRELLNKIKDVLIDGYIIEKTEDEYIELFEVEKERKKIFERDFFTGADRIHSFVRFVDKFIRRSQPFCLYYVDIKNLGYINYKCSIQKGNQILEKLAEGMIKSGKFIRVMRSGSDSFIGMSLNCNQDYRKFFDILSKEILSETGACIDKKFYSTGLFYIAWAFYPNDGKTFEDLLYRLKTTIKKFKFENKLYLEF
ncbi:HD domain-containing phosphohydrolase [Hippea jasoniae]|uniref:HD domain-containing phosphohydrolase n=1 Tax=Hippea jasoniae TaxID=944479 RepID=UPI000557790E|nr:HD domain-containing phosphohydrolase [Hippea jasoniae]